MSYEIVKRISKRKDGRIFINSACNNVQPRHYSTWELYKDEPNNEIKNLHLFHSIIGNSLSLDTCTSVNWKYAIKKFYEHCRENDIDTSDIWDSYYDKGIESLKPYYQIFEKYLNEKENDNKYYLATDRGIVKKMNKRTFEIDSDFENKEKYLHDYKTATLMMQRFGDSIIDKHNIKMCEFNEKDLNLSNDEKLGLEV